MKIAIYDPYLETLGGGEKYICMIAEILDSTHDVDLFTNSRDIVKSRIEKYLNVNLKRLNIIYLPKFEYVHNKPHKRSPFSIINYYRDRKQYGSEFHKNYDFFINITNKAPIFCNAKKGILIVQFPLENRSSDYIVEKNWLSKMLKKIYYDFEWKKRLSSYNFIIVYSEFVKKWVKKLWDKDSIVVYPPSNICDTEKIDKKKTILSVGRFFIGGHNKKQDVMIEAFKDLYNTCASLKEWKFHLIGGISSNRKSLAYLEEVKLRSKGYPIFIHENVSLSELQKYYKESSIFWHATGCNENESQNPEKMEHFGMTTVEAMSYECIPIVINRGGQSEIIQDKINGFLWNNTEELKSFTVKLCENPELLNTMGKRAKERSEAFSMQEFNKQILDILQKISD